jgi:hypothetical protein
MARWALSGRLILRRLRVWDTASLVNLTVGFVDESRNSSHPANFTVLARGDRHLPGLWCDGRLPLNGERFMPM